MTRRIGIIAGIAVILIAAAIILLARKKHVSEEVNICDGCTPCKYDTVFIPAKVIRIDTTANPIVLDVTVQRPEPFKDSGDTRVTDTLDFYNNSNHRRLTKSELSQANLKPGDLLECLCYKILQGTCEPYGYNLSLMPFKPK